MFSNIALRSSQFKRDMAPMINSLLISACPAFHMHPSHSFPPEECCFRTRPNHTAKSLSGLKLSIRGTKASTANALISLLRLTWFASVVPILSVSPKRRSVWPLLQFVALSRQFDAKGRSTPREPAMADHCYHPR